MDVRTPISTLYGDHLTRFSEIWKGQIQKLNARFGSGILKSEMPGETATDVPVIFVSPEAVQSVLKHLKTEPGFEYGFLSDLTATDELPQVPRFLVVYQLFSHATFARIRLKVPVHEDQELSTAVGIWAGANWAEREVFDMYGIRFSGHPDLRRILMDSRWQGHPLRKDYPLRGYQFFPTPEPVDPDLLK